ncbi:MAG: hypothetical protein JWO19_3925 [Bryobacterales bacterium]|nr:hypothetical protein [Bryobacterales bacterium]
MKFLHDEKGQDVIEYSLLLAFVVVASAALLMINSRSIVGIWTGANTLLTTASSMAKSGSS